MHLKKCLILCLILIASILGNAQTKKQTGLLWEITGKNLKKPSYLYGTMHISKKLAFHLGDSFYISLLNCDMVALEQNLDSVIHKWISEDEGKPEDKNKVYSRNTTNTLNMGHFKLNSFNKELIERRLGAKVREINYLLKRGNEDDFEEDAWLDLYIYQIGKRTGKLIGGVEGYQESRDLVEKANKEPDNNLSERKKLKPYTRKMREQVADAYRKGEIFMIDSIDRLTESEHFREYMLYKRNANMVRRMDSIMQKGITLFTGVGCAHLPGTKGVIQMLLDSGYKVRPVQSLANHKSKMAQKYEDMTYAHVMKPVSSDDGMFTAPLPSFLTKVRDYESYSSYLCPDLANGYYYQIEKISSNISFSDKTPEDILLVIDTLIFENIPGDIKTKEEITSNGYIGYDIVSELKTGDLNRFNILVSPFNIYIIRLAGKKEFATSSTANNFFKELKINEGIGSIWHSVHSSDSIYTLQLPVSKSFTKIKPLSKVNMSFEYSAFEKATSNTYFIKHLDLLNYNYLESDTFELRLMANSFASTDNYKIVKTKNFIYQGYNGLEATYITKKNERMFAKFYLCGTRYIMFLLKPKTTDSFNHPFFTSLHFNGKASYNYSKFKDTTIHFTVETPCVPFYVKEEKRGYYYNDDDGKPNKYKGKYQEMYFYPGSGNDFIVAGNYHFGYYERAYQDKTEYYKELFKFNSLKCINKNKEVRNGIEYNSFTLTDTATNRQVRLLHALRGEMVYYLSAFMDTIAGSNQFVNTFFNTFDISDTLIGTSIFDSKSDRFFADFTSGDSATRKASIKNFNDVRFSKKDFNNIKNILDTLNTKGDAAKLRTELIWHLGAMDSSASIVLPYLNELYNRYVDTAFLQIEILKAIARQRNLPAYKMIKPILANDIPISDNSYDMEGLIYSFSDSLKLTKLLLPELIELTAVPEYRSSAYNVITTMNDSGIIKMKDFKRIHKRLIFECNIEMKRTMASLTKASYENEYSYYDESYGSHSSPFVSLLDLTLPMRNKSKEMQTITDKILKITDNNKRLELLPTMLKHKVIFHDTVFETLAKNKDTRKELYKILYDGKSMKLLPNKYYNQKPFIEAEIYSSGNRYYNKIDTVALVNEKVLNYGNKDYRIYIFKYKGEDDDNWTIYTSDAMPMDTTKLPEPNATLPFISQTESLNDDDVEADVINRIILENYMRYVREKNGGYYDSYYRNDSSFSYDFDF